MVSCRRLFPDRSVATIPTLPATELAAVRMSVGDMAIAPSEGELNPTLTPAVAPPGRASRHVGARSLSAPPLLTPTVVTPGFATGPSDLRSPESTTRACASFFGPGREASFAEAARSRASSAATSSAESHGVLAFADDPPVKDWVER